MKTLLPCTVGVLLVLGCSTEPSMRTQPIVSQPSQAPDPSRPCEIPIAEDARLSLREQCWLELFAQRCNEHDVCLVECLANEKHRVRHEDGGIALIGGGCWHLCFAYSDIEWTGPEGWHKCEALDSKRPE